MTARSTARPETWRDWMPEGAPEPNLVTREELIGQLAEQGLAVSEDDFQYWQGAGVIPFGVRRWHQGATRLLYPVWMIDLIRQLRIWQVEGRKLADIGPELRRHGVRAVSASAIAVLPADLETALSTWARKYERTFGASVARIRVVLEEEDGGTLPFAIDPHTHANQPPSCARTAGTKEMS